MFRYEMSLFLLFCLYFLTINDRINPSLYVFGKDEDTDL